MMIYQSKDNLILSENRYKAPHLEYYQLRTNVKNKNLGQFIKCKKYAFGFAIKKTIFTVITYFRFGDLTL